MRLFVKKQKRYLHAEFKHDLREEKALHVWQRYQNILNGKILDVGANKGYLRKFLRKDIKYTSLDKNPPADVILDLEKNKLPFKNNSFNCVLCLDVLEHLDNPHEVFDELCRVTRSYVIIALPNPWGIFMSMLKTGYYTGTIPIKFHNLPIHPPKDRHKWFYGIHEAKQFIIGRGKINGMNVVQIDESKRLSIKQKVYRQILRLMIHKDIDPEELLSGPIWAVLRKKD